MSALFTDCVRCRKPHNILLYGKLTRHCNRCAHEVVEARGESIRALTANLATATAIAERDAARLMLGECERERDALKSGKWAGAWEPLEGTGEMSWARFSPLSVLVALAFVPGRWSTGRDKANKAPDIDAAKAAADAHLVAAGWWLDGGAHKAGEAK